MAKVTVNVSYSETIEIPDGMLANHDRYDDTFLSLCDAAVRDRIKRRDDRIVSWVHVKKEELECL